MGRQRKVSKGKPYDRRGKVKKEREDTARDRRALETLIKSWKKVGGATTRGQATRRFYDSRQDAKERYGKATAGLFTGRLAQADSVLRDITMKHRIKELFPEGGREPDHEELRAELVKLQQNHINNAVQTAFDKANMTKKPVLGDASLIHTTSIATQTTVRGVGTRSIKTQAGGGGVRRTRDVASQAAAKGRSVGVGTSGGYGSAMTGSGTMGAAATGMGIGDVDMDDMGAPHEDGPGVAEPGTSEPRKRVTLGGAGNFRASVARKRRVVDPEADVDAAQRGEAPGGSFTEMLQDALGSGDPMENVDMDKAVDISKEPVYVPSDFRLRRRAIQPLVVGLQHNSRSHRLPSGRKGRVF